MDMFSFLSLVLVTAGFTVTVYLIQKNNNKFFEKLMEKFNEKTVVTMPWNESVDHPENQLQDDDQVPLENLDEDEFKKNVEHMFTVKERDAEAEEAQNSELN